LSSDIFQRPFPNNIQGDAKWPKSNEYGKPDYVCETLRNAIYVFKDVWEGYKEGEEYDVKDRQVKRHQQDDWLRPYHDEGAIHCDTKLGEERGTADFEGRTKSIITGDGAKVLRFPREEL